MRSRGYPTDRDRVVRRSKSGWSTSEMGQTEKNSVRAYVFRFAPELGHCSMESAFPKRVRFGLMHRNSGELLDHLIRVRQQHWINIEPKRLRSLKIDDQVKFCWPFDRKVGWAFAVENPTYVIAGAPEHGWII
jgi:hypothetical protein